MKSIATYQAIGRLGNSMSQLAAVIAYAKANNIDFSPPVETDDEKWRALYFSHLFHPQIENPALKRIVISENGFPYQPIPFKPEWAEDHVIEIEGFRQSEKYYNIDDVLKALKFPWEPQPNTVSVHVRRGDNLVRTHIYPLISDEWYFTQMSKFPGAKFWLFSDDPQYVKDTFGGRQDCTMIIDTLVYPADPRPEVQDLILGSWCAHQICSSSSFSLWQSLLNRNPNKRAIIPKHFLVPGYSGIDQSEIVPYYFEKA